MIIEYAIFLLNIEKFLIILKLNSSLTRCLVKVQFSNPSVIGLEGKCT